ncbi:hypothetical protein G9A89_002117, partial [Geosiphon pyriformis]
MRQQTSIQSTTKQHSSAFQPTSLRRNTHEAEDISTSTFPSHLNLPVAINQFNQQSQEGSNSKANLPLFETPPVSPGGQSIFRLPTSPPPLHPQDSSFNNKEPPKSKNQFWLPPTPPNGLNQETPNFSSTSHTYFENNNALNKIQSEPSTNVFSLPIDLGTTNSNEQHTFTSSSNSRPIMYHHTSVIHPAIPRQQQNSSIPADRPLSLAEKRELARKVSHSAIERRRRERINDKIIQLQQLVPSCANQPQIHKLTILQGAIDYIGYLQSCLAEKRKHEMNSTNDAMMLEEWRFVRQIKSDGLKNYQPPVSSKTFEISMESQSTKNSMSSSDTNIIRHDITSGGPEENNFSLINQNLLQVPSLSHRSNSLFRRINTSSDITQIPSINQEISLSHPENCEINANKVASTTESNNRVIASIKTITSPEEDRYKPDSTNGDS